MSSLSRSALLCASQRRGMPAILACALAIVCGGPAGASDTPGKSDKQQAPILAELGQSRLQLAIGDKLKLNVFEKLGADDEAARSANLIERVELSGEFTVQSDGGLYLPLLGPQVVYGKNVVDVQAQIEAAFQAAFGKAGRVSIAVTARNPVYVVGRIARPGTYDYSAGMTALHALAQAGGPEQGARAELYDTVREQRRMEEAQDKQKRLIARLDTLRAERAGVPAQPSAKLLDLASDTEAPLLMQEQQSMRKLTIEARQIRLKGLDATIEAATRELAIQRGKLERMQENSVAKAERVEVLQQLSTRGNGGSYQMLQAKSEYGDFQERLSEVQAIISQIEERRAQAQNEKSRITTESQLDLERDIALVEEQNAEAAHQMATSAQLLLIARQARRDLSLNPGEVSYVIIRSSPSGPQTFEADEATALQPGDLVKVQQQGQVPYGAASLQWPTN